MGEKAWALFNETQIDTLYSVLKKMSTNDLKYGSGTPDWHFRLSENEMRLEFRSQSHYKVSRHGTGRGTSGMIRRLSGIGGTLHMRMDAIGDDSMAADAGPRLDEPEQATIHIVLRVPL